MEYTGAKIPDSMPDLGRIKAAAERICVLTGEVDGFLFRCRGPRGGEAQSASTAPQPPDTYRNDIENVFEHINRLEAVVSQLREIG